MERERAENHPTPRRPVGRPRIATNEDIRGVLEALVQEGVKQLPLGQFAREIAVRLNVSRASAYRMVRRAQDEGAILTQEF